jgi:hypothetical protein
MAQPRSGRLPFDDLARDLAFPTTGLSARQGPFGGICPNVSNFLSLRFSSSMVIILGFDQSTGLVGWTHVAQFICPAEFQGSDVLCNPAFAHAVDFSIAKYASSTRCLPHLEPSVWRKLPARDCSHILDVNERHGYSLGWCVERWVTIAPWKISFLFEKISNALTQAFALLSEGFTRGDKLGKFAQPTSVNGNETHS